MPSGYATVKQQWKEREDGSPPRYDPRKDMLAPDSAMLEYITIPPITMDGISEERPRSRGLCGPLSPRHRHPSPSHRMGYPLTPPLCRCASTACCVETPAAWRRPRSARILGTSPVSASPSHRPATERGPPTSAGTTNARRVCTDVLLGSVGVTPEQPPQPQQRPQQLQPQPQPQPQPGSLPQEQQQSQPQKHKMEEVHAAQQQQTLQPQPQLQPQVFLGATVLPTVHSSEQASLLRAHSSSSSRVLIHTCSFTRAHSSSSSHVLMHTEQITLLAPPVTSADEPRRDSMGRYVVLLLLLALPLLLVGVLLRPFLLPRLHVIPLLLLVVLLLHSLLHVHPAKLQRIPPVDGQQLKPPPVQLPMPPTRPWFLKLRFPCVGPLWLVLPLCYALCYALVLITAMALNCRQPCAPLILPMLGPPPPSPWPPDILKPPLPPLQPGTYLRASVKWSVEFVGPELLPQSNLTGWY